MTDHPFKISKEAAGATYIRESALIRSILWLRDENILMVPDNGIVYKIIFINGVNDESLDMACDFALNKVLKLILL